MEKKRLHVIPIVLLIALLLYGCGGSTSSPTAEASQNATSIPATKAIASPQATIAPTTSANIREAYAKPEVLVDTQWVLANLSDPTVHLVDVSPRAATYQLGHLPGAKYANPDTDLTNPDNPIRGEILTQEALSALFSKLGIEREHTVVFYDDSNNLFAARAYWVLKYYQHGDVRIYDGGSKKWVSDGEELVSDPVETASSHYEAGPPDPEIMTTWPDVVASVDDPGTLYCDARSLGEYTGESVNAERGGHIPGAVNVEWSQAVRADGTFKEASELDLLYHEAGFSPDKRIITYCQTGVRGAHTWFVLHELLGYPNVRNYDGSWEEYGNRDDSPIEK